MVQFWGPPLLPSDLGQKQRQYCEGGRHALPSHHPSPSTQPHYPSLGDPAGYLRAQPGSSTLPNKPL
ncbi:AC094643.2 [Phodopus roborovskii]|uniref:AC094643.2 protein n=1 Tax=Phodopus roborovskii TaxID=109678 RepID=A0AAU9YX53_PHORO|nr:AC094643.2 [Phodopus roborovskii]